MGKEEQNTQKIVYPYQFKIDLDLLEKRAVFQSTINECLQDTNELQEINFKSSQRTNPKF
jgi:hypothetical protein